MEQIYNYATSKSSDIKRIMQFYYDLSPCKVTNRDLLSELCWIVYSSGFRFEVISRYWPSIRRAYTYFDVGRVASFTEDLELHANRICLESGFRNLKKAKWCIQNAQRIIELDEEMENTGGLRGYFIEISKREPMEIVNLTPILVEELRFKGIGETTIFHLMKNIGIDIFKPDIHVRRVLAKLGLTDGENAPAQDVCKAMLFLSSASGMKIVELDTLLFIFGKLTSDSINPLGNPVEH